MMILTIILRVYDLYNYYFQEYRRCHQEMEEVQSKAIQKILQQLADQLENEGKEYVQVPLAQIFWYHHIPLLSKVKDEAQRAYDITETA